MENVPTDGRIICALLKIEIPEGLDMGAVTVAASEVNRTYPWRDDGCTLQITSTYIYFKPKLRLFPGEKGPFQLWSLGCTHRIKTALEYHDDLMAEIVFTY